MTCACPPGGPYSAAPCCRENADERCHESRCLHPEPDAETVLATLKAKHQAMTAARIRREHLRTDLGEAQNRVEELAVEIERLERQLLDAARGGHVDGGDTEQAPEALSAALTGTTHPQGLANIE